MSLPKISRARGVEEGEGGMWLEVYRKSPEVALWRALEGRITADVVGSSMPVLRASNLALLVLGALKPAMEMLANSGLRVRVVIRMKLCDDSFIVITAVPLYRRIFSNCTELLA
jgi:hypothetical protein